MNMMIETINFYNNIMKPIPNTSHSLRNIMSPHVNNSQGKEYEVDPSSPRISDVDDGKIWLKLLLQKSYDTHRIKR